MWCHIGHVGGPSVVSQKNAFFWFKKNKKTCVFYSLAFCYTRMFNKIYFNKVLCNFAAYCCCEHLGLNKMLKNTFMKRVLQSHIF